MAASIRFISALFLLCLVTQGNCICDNVSDFVITQTQTGKKVEGKTEWKMTIKNDCVCTRGDIKLSCNGFQTAEKIDPSILQVTEDKCLLNNGGVLHGGESFSFTYAWDTAFPFKAIDSTIACS